MQYRKLLFPLVVIISVMVFVGNSPAFAKVCPVGKVPVTIVNKKNIVEICVSEQGIEHLSNGTDKVIPATCPCYSKDSLDTILADAGQSFTCHVRPGASDIGTCTLIRCDSTDETIIIEAQEGPYKDPLDGESKLHNCTFFTTDDWPINWSYGSALSNNLCYTGIDGTYSENDSASEAEGDACVAILKTFVTSP